MRSSLRSLKVVVDYPYDLSFLNVYTDLESPLLAFDSLYLEGSLDALPNWVSSPVISPS